MDPPPIATKFEFAEANPYLSDIQLVKASKAARALLGLQRGDDERLSRLREQQHGERAGFNPHLKFQAVLGALAENRRGSFSHQGDNEKLHSFSVGPIKEKDESPNFADVVLQAMEKRRKSVTDHEEGVDTSNPSNGFVNGRSTEASADPSQEAGDISQEDSRKKVERPDHDFEATKENGNDRIDNNEKAPIFPQRDVTSDLSMELNSFTEQDNKNLRINNSNGEGDKDLVYVDQQRTTLAHPSGLTADSDYINVKKLDAPAQDAMSPITPDIPGAFPHADVHSSLASTPALVSSQYSVSTGDRSSNYGPNTPSTEISLPAMFEVKSTGPPASLGRGAAIANPIGSPLNPDKQSKASEFANGTTIPNSPKGSQISFSQKRSFKGGSECGRYS